MDEILGLLVVQTGRLLVYLVSAGRWRGEPLFGDEGRIHSAAGSLWFVREGRTVFTENGLMLIGLGFYGAVIAAIVAFFALT